MDAQSLQNFHLAIGPFIPVFVLIGLVFLLSQGLNAGASNSRRTR